MSDQIELCGDCTYAEGYKDDPEAFEEVLGRFAAAGFTCDGPVSEIVGSPFAVPMPRARKMCGLDKALASALEAQGYADTPEENTGRTMFFEGELELSPIKPSE